MPPNAASSRPMTLAQPFERPRILWDPQKCETNCVLPEAAHSELKLQEAVRSYGDHKQIICYQSVIYKYIHRDLHYVTMTATLDFHEAAAESALKRIAAENSKAWHRGIKSKVENKHTFHSASTCNDRVMNGFRWPLGLSKWHPGCRPAMKHVTKSQSF